MQSLPTIVELYMQVPGSRRLDEIVMTNGPLGPRFTLKPYTCAWPSAENLDLDGLEGFYRAHAPCGVMDSIWRHLYVAKGIRASYNMHFILHSAPNEELPLIGQPLPTAGTVAARVAAIEGKPKNEVITPVKESIVKQAPTAPVKKHRYNTRSKMGRYESDSEDELVEPPAPYRHRRIRANSDDSEWEEDCDSDGRPIRCYVGPRVKPEEFPDVDSDSGENTRAAARGSEPESSSDDSGEDSEVDEGVKRTYPSKKERLQYFPQGLELYVQDIGGPKWTGIRLDIEVIPPFLYGSRAGLDRGKQVRFQTPKHPDGLHEHHLVAHYRKHILKEHVSSSSNGLQCIFVASGRHKDRSLASLLLNEKKKELKQTGSSIQPVQLDADQVVANLVAQAAAAVEATPLQEREAAAAAGFDSVKYLDKIIQRLHEPPVSKSSKLINEACLSLDDEGQEALKKAFEFEAKYPYNWAFHDLPPPLSADVADEDYDEPPKAESADSDDEPPPLISIAEITLERLEAKEAALKAERTTLDRIETKLELIRLLEQEVGPRRILWCAEEFGSDYKESSLDKVENDFRLELEEIERLEVRLAAVRALGDQVAARRAALLKAAESM